MTASLRLKMIVRGMDPQTDGDGTKIGEGLTLDAVYGDGEANKQWSKWTPSGTLQFHISNPGAFGHAKQGDYFFVDLIPTDKESI
jgi:hypothetical protein